MLFLCIVYLSSNDLSVSQLWWKNKNVFFLMLIKLVLLKSLPQTQGQHTYTEKITKTHYAHFLFQWNFFPHVFLHWLRSRWVHDSNIKHSKKNNISSHKKSMLWLVIMNQWKFNVSNKANRCSNWEQFRLMSVKLEANHSRNVAIIEL